jgi:hypothetical protein
LTKDVRNFFCGHHLRSPSIFVPRLRSKNKPHGGAMGTLPNAGCQITLHRILVRAGRGARDRHSAANPGPPALLRQIGARAAAQALDERQRVLGQTVGQHATPGRGGSEYPAQPVGVNSNWTVVDSQLGFLTASSCILRDRLQAPRAAAGRATLAGRALRWLSAQVVYRVNGAVVARARQSVTTLTRAGLPAAVAAAARSRAGRMSSGSSTCSPYPPRISANRS